MNESYENKILDIDKVLDIANELKSKTKRGSINNIMLENSRFNTYEKEIYDYIKRNSLTDIH